MIMKKFIAPIATLLLPVTGFAYMGGPRTDGGAWDAMGYMMQDYGLHGFFAFLVMIIWGMVGILAIVWLWKQINSK
jgi:hypothetical protein